MRLHTNTLTLDDITRATRAAGMRGVYADAMRNGSRTHRIGWEVKLTGTSSRRPNTGHGGSEPFGGEHAATWDEWGMFLAALFAIDPAMIVGTVKRPIYAGADHFHAATADRYRILTAPYQHGGGGHKWEWAGDGLACTMCEATRPRFVDPAPYLEALATVTA